MTRLKIGIITLILLTFCIQLYAGDTTGLQGAWLLDEESSTRVDETANGNDLTDNNTVLFGTGQFGNAADFERDTSEFLSITDASQTGLDPSEDHSYGLWFKPESISIGQGPLDKTGSNQGYGMPIGGDNLMNCQIEGTDSKVTSTIAVDTWSHLACTYDGSDIRSYFDGSVETTTAKTGAITNTSLAFVVGALDTVPNDPSDGLIDETWFFSRKLETAEVVDLMDNGIAAFRSTGRNRLIIVGVVMFAAKHFQYYDLVNTHRKKFDIKRPSWMEWIYG